MKKIYIFCIAFLLLFNCCRDECPDYIAHSFTETDKAWFSFEPNDTVHYRDVKTDEFYYLTCVSKEVNRDSIFTEDPYCKNNGSHHIKDVMNIVFTSDIPHFDNEYLKVKINLETAWKYESIVIIELDGAKGYPYYFVFDNNEERLIDYGGPSTTSGVSYKDTILINGKTYTNVYPISFRKDEERIKNVFYDSIYYSKKGFLKFISSQFGYNMEITD
jgi:hypothetical protein